MVFEPVERIEKLGNVLVISNLARGESNLVHSVVHGIEHPGVQLINVVLQVVWNKPSRAFAGFSIRDWYEFVEGVHQYTNDFRALSVDNSDCILSAVHRLVLHSKSVITDLLACPIVQAQ